MSTGAIGNVGVIGLGIMGSAYAANLIRSGFAVQGADPSASAREAVSGLGVTTYSAPGPWLAACDAVILSLSRPDVLRAVGADLERLLRAGQIVVETGTFALADKLALRDRLAVAGITVLDCPVSGTGSQAKSGDLVMMASGEDAALEAILPVLEGFTRLVQRVGPFGTGIRMKLMANHAVAVHNAAAAETLAYADALGLDREAVYRLLSTGAGQSRMSDLRMPLMISGAYRPATATLRMFEKDLDLIETDLASRDRAAPLFAQARRLYSQALADLPDDFDTAAIFETF
ncbi:NAD(P)-dependent oxidoreductase [Tritonibacter horizontis]|uniref:2-hydroxy-3-oxopropionate reductase n=1 Tax=Tritonibacter horizontis TaxID=1768241 RepID=A0A132C370_9RHOB|nr:NAD(P)-dependent oxidoreductase [Tritonibacter horizontis]KUP94510.1 2-hydroxy-3-oxopropionate reductase [Tritonibacter horizontis]